MTPLYEKKQIKANDTQIINSFLLCSFLGFLGIHNFYNRKILFGILQFLTFGGFLIWQFIDLYLITIESFKDKNGNILKWEHNLQNYHAGFKIRLCANIIDVIFLSPIFIIILSLPYLDILLYKDHNVHIQEILSSSDKDILNIIINSFYFIFLTSSKSQASFGKQLVGIYVVDHQGKKLSILRSFIRYICYFFSYITLFLGFFMAGWTKNKTALHDMISRTYVLYGKPKNEK